MAVLGMTPDRVVTVLQQWARLGVMITAARQKRKTDWTPMHRLIEAARPRLQLESKRLRKILCKSNTSLNPLKDPLLVDFGAHRWLSGAREEAYSDWLGWIVERLQIPERVFRLFGIDNDSSIALCHGVSLTVDREVPIPQGRLDLVIRYAEKALIVVEVKKIGADQADTAKQQGYTSWVESQPQPRPHKHSVLLVSTAECGDYRGFRPQLWGDLCIKLRQIVPMLCQEERLTEAAMILAFVGAVEQNILRFSAHLIQRVYDRHPIMLPADIGNHIEQSMTT